MIVEHGVVESTEAGEAVVRITVPADCESCAVRENCYAAGRLVRGPAPADVEPEDTVRVIIENASVLGISALLYGVPLVATLAGILAGYYLLFGGMREDPRVLLSFAVGVGTLAGSGFLIAAFDRRRRNRVRVRLEKEEPGEAECPDPDDHDSSSL
jgi:positive regulator of sigma E activity